MIDRQRLPQVPARKENAVLEIIQSLRDINGLDVTTSSWDCAPYASDASGLVGHEPIAIVRPRSIPALTALIGRAAELGVPLQPVSSSAPHQRGDTLCRPGSIVVEMSAFNQVVRVDRRNRVALLEAGVTFAQLRAALTQQRLRPMLPLCPRPGKSALTAYLEREPIIYPRFQWDLSDPLLCIETIFGTGELFRTGGAAGPGTLSEQWAAGDAQKTPLGPGHSDIARIVQGAQGNLGIVTWCSAKVELMPASETLYRLDSPDLAQLIGLCYRLLRRNLPDICFIVDSAALAALQGQDLPSRPSHWHLLFSLSAPPLLGAEKLEWMQREVQQYCAEAGLSAQLQGFVPRHQALYRRLTGADPETSRRWWKHAGRPATAEIFFQTTLDRCTRFLPVHERVRAAQGWTAPTLCYIQPQLGGRCCHMEFIVPHDGDAQAAAALSALLETEVAELENSGAFFSRPYGPVIERTKARDSAAMRQRLGHIFDPHGVMSASQWPIVRHAQGRIPAGAGALS